MVDTLIDATAKTIARHGLDGTTTPKIAKAAGVSVGSLYQYFDGKDALIDALLMKLTNDVRVALRTQLPLAEVGTLRDLIGGAIRIGFGVLGTNEGLYLELIRNWHRLPTQRVTDALQDHFFETSRIYFLKYYRELPIENLHTKLFVVVNSTLFTMVRLLTQESALLRQEDVATGLTDMIVGYIEQDAVAARVSAG
jgi:AcrR family transcriptional regulator